MTESKMQGKSKNMNSRAGHKEKHGTGTEMRPRDPAGGLEAEQTGGSAQGDGREAGHTGLLGWEAVQPLILQAQTQEQKQT